MFAFATLVIGNLGLIFTNRSWTRSILSMLGIPNVALWWVSAAALGFLGLTITIPFLQKLFSFGSIEPWELALCLGTGLFSILISESLKIPMVQRALTRK
jgi:Ca2+-transporting ATPase